MTSMEKLNQCPLCLNPLINSAYDISNRLFLEAVDMLVSHKTFKIEKCPSCSLLFTNPRPTENEIKKYYHSDAYISHTENKQTIKERIYFMVQKTMLRKKIALLKKHTKPQCRKLLDFGCGTGNFIDYAQQNGFISTGYEPEINARQKAEAKDLNIINDLDVLFGNKTGAYDVITLWHVLEHLHDFPSVLDDFHTKLNIDGVLLIAVPMAKSTDANYYKKYWAGWDLPRHLYHFTRESIVSSCTKAGYDLVAKRGMPFDSYYVSWLSEQNKRNRMAPLNAFLIGFWSNMKATLGKTPWSSEVFVFRKRG